MSKLKCPKYGADIGAVVAAHAGRATSQKKAAAAHRNAEKGGRRARALTAKAKAPNASGNSRFTVSLKSAGNPDHSQFLGSGLLSPTLERSCGSIGECQETVRRYIEDYGLGGGNWAGGEVRKDGKFVGRVSFNGRFWPAETENADATMKGEK